ncbi:MAG: ribosome silencing factor [Treponema sp.]|jgi:ribosome-associated protein|nr:ribosome silencing factor [Treponema sp.]
MEDTLLKNDMGCIAQDMKNMLHEHNGVDALVLDLREMEPSAWTDFFVIATATSNAHMDGLERHIKEFCHERGIEILRKSRKLSDEDEWRIIDLGSTVIHLMSRKAREFYDLERLYSRG